MPKQRIFSVHQRSMISVMEREMGMFTDSAMADQSIDHLYRYAWQAIVAREPSLWFDPNQRDAIVAEGFETWSVNDKNSMLPTFFKKPHDLWNQVPPSADDFKFKQEVVDEGTVPVVEVKKLF